MAKITRVNGNVQAFASQATGTERTIFGEVTQSNDLTAQFTADFLRGWGIVGPSDQPALEDFNGAMYTHGQMLAYLHQMGVAEWNNLQEYHIGSICTVAGLIYSSLTNANVGNNPATSAANWLPIAGSSAPIGSFTNLKAVLAAASTTVNYTADELTVKRSLGGQAWTVKTLAASINVGTGGAGGMDTGAAPVSGYIGIYAIYNPTTGASALLGVNASAAVLPEVYGGANMPAGFTASALIGVWPTNGSAQLVAGNQRNREFSRTIGITVLSGSALSPTFNPVALSLAVPQNAKTAGGTLSIQASTGTGGISMNIASDSIGTASQGINGFTSNANGLAGAFHNLFLSTIQLAYFNGLVNGPTAYTDTIVVNRYSF